MRDKIKYQGGITKLLCSRAAAWNKSKFMGDLYSPKLKNLVKTDIVDLDIISFSGSSSFEDQLLSIYSFLINAGTPLHWTIYSDKSYSDEQKSLFKEFFPFISISDWDEHDDIRNNELLKDYLGVCHLAKKINLIIGHSYKHQTIYLDSDILFYKNISAYLNTGLLNKGLWYAPDAQGDVELSLNAAKNTIYSLNSGLLFLNKDFDKTDVFEYLESLKGNYQYFSEQSSFEYAFRKQKANILDPRQFVVDSADQFDFSSRYYPETIAMRHYTTPVRHKMWQNGWKWHFNL